MVLAPLARIALALCAVVLVPAAVPAQAAATVAAVPAASAPTARQPVLVTPWFRFHSDFDFNLLDAVLTSATARRQKQSDGFHGECFTKLVLEERSAWEAAVSYFAETVAATRDFSRERIIVRARLAGFAQELDDDDRRDLALSTLFLAAAARAYRACGWSEQDATNRRWVGELGSLLERHADAIGRRLEQVFEQKWRTLPIDVDVVATVGWSGADTIAFGSLPTHTQISSRNPGYQGKAALEMIFHEASHELVSPNNGPVANLLRTSAATAGVGIDRNLWHAVQFVTVGEVTRGVLDAAGEGPYVPFSEANDVFGGSWKPLHEPLGVHWVPFVRGMTSATEPSEREKAIRALLVAIGTPPETP